MITYYQVLGVPMTATSELIESKFAERAARTNISDDERRILVKARDVLVDPSRRKRYDAKLKAFTAPVLPKLQSVDPFYMIDKVMERLRLDVKNASSYASSTTSVHSRSLPDGSRLVQHKEAHEERQPKQAPKKAENVSHYLVRNNTKTSVTEDQYKTYLRQQAKSMLLS
jgi:curved DNA-binding protein CbpA